MTVETLISIIVTSIISVIAGIVISKYYSGRKELAFAVMYRHLIDPNVDRLTNKIVIMFDDRPIYRLTEVRLALWNCGNAELRGADVIGPKGLVFDLGQAQGVGVSDPVTFHSSIEATASITPSEDVSIWFNYLNAGDAITLIAFADISAAPEVGLDEAVLEGDIIGCRRPFFNMTHRVARPILSGTKLWQYLLFFAYVMAVVGALVSITLFVLAFLDPHGYGAIKSILLDDEKRKVVTNASLILLMIFALFSYLIFFSLGKGRVVPQAVAEHFRFMIPEASTATSDQPVEN